MIYRFVFLHNSVLSQHRYVQEVKTQVGDVEDSLLNFPA